MLQALSQKTAWKCYGGNPSLFNINTSIRNNSINVPINRDSVKNSHFLKASAIMRDMRVFLSQSRKSYIFGIYRDILLLSFKFNMKPKPCIAVVV